MTDRESIVRKIQSCLALGSSPNENEAKAALLAARRLMATYKVEMSDIPKEEEKIERKCSSIEYTRRTTPWVSDLAAVIAENHCCITFTMKQYRRKRRKIGFYGYSKDVEVCCSVFEFAVNTILGNVKKNADSESKYAYCYGFVIGLNQAYEAQNQENKQYGLVLVPSKEVKDFAHSCTGGNDDYDPKRISDEESFKKGILDGQNHLNKKLEATE